MKSLYFFLALLFCFIRLSAQDEVLEKLEEQDSLRSKKTEKIYKSNPVTSEVHNMLFRNIYRSQVNNEELEFKKEIERLKPYDNKLIDTVIFVQINVLGESVYDTTIRSNGFEAFISQKLHTNTKQKVIRNRYLILKEGDVFSPYQAYENARLMRTSGIFHDVRIVPQINPNDTNHITLIYRIQDVLPYGVSLGVYGTNNFSWGLENINIAGLTHRISTDFRYNGNDTLQKFGFGVKYLIPNVIKRSFIDAYVQGRYFSTHKGAEVGVYREFVNRKIRWAGGDIFGYRDVVNPATGGGNEFTQYIENKIWLSHAFPLRNYNATIHSVIVGISHELKNHQSKPTFNPAEPYKYANSSFILSSLGYSRIKFVQDRLLNGFGRTEDIPIGISVNALIGKDFTEYRELMYYGGQVLAQYHTGKGYYINLNTRVGFFDDGIQANQGVFDFNLQNVSATYKLGNFRLRNYFKLRTTIGVNQDQDISLNDYEGIRGINNADFKGRSRFTSSFQSNLFIPLSLMGFRFSVFGLIEAAKIQPSFNNFFQTPLMTGFTAGIAIKNENLIFDVLQIQYGYYPSTSSLSQRGIVLSSIVPFNFQKLDISRPRIVRYE